VATAGAPRYAPALCIALAALVVASVVSGWVLGGRIFDGIAPGGAPVAVPDRGAGETVVELSDDAERHPAAGPVRDQLQRYFDAINSRDHALWTTAVVAERVAAQPREQWTAAVDTTVDGTIRVDRIDDLGPDRVLALVRFVSTQSLDDAPAELRVPRICWRGALPMTGSPPRLATGDAASMLSASC